ncbi:hypothetical protein SAMN02745166_00630 [Prosthecobacter debontii]|uniref:Uncharacterized protein n=1 Tax=Prosthecobacter debontii TaxID=48467 RepID=A0A1T4WTI3_9BACT|nr:hypothetical protein [Prosthecobacter debontii]SKA80417.1 hypothetical protein SAMN02745166_00630 [Prosthecobacter debontii]
MFKKILQSLSKSQAAKPTAAAPPPRQETAKPGEVLQKISKVSPASAAPVEKTPDELCEIAPKTPKDQVQARLKLLYRRYNRGASSLDPKIRAEADLMLDAIVKVREKYFGEI